MIVRESEVRHWGTEVGTSLRRTTPRTPARGGRSGVLLSFLYAVGLLLPLSAVPGASVAARAALALAVAPAVGALARRSFPLERQWMARVALLFSSFLLGAIIVAASAADSAGPGLWEDLGRQAFIVAGGGLLPAMLRTPERRLQFAKGLSWVGIIASLGILYAYVEFAGVRLVSPTELASFKYYADRTMGIAVNPLSFAVALALAMGVSAWWPRRGLRYVVLMIGLAAVLLSGARTTILSLAAAAAVVPLVRVAARQRGRARMVATVAVTTCVVALAAAAVDFAASLDGEAVSALTTGRYDLWVAAMKQVADHPLFGSGAVDAFQQIERYLPGYYRWGAESLIESAGSGGYHNAYLALLTQRGLLGFVAGMFLLSFLLRRAFRQGALREEALGRDALSAAIAPYVIVGLGLRALGEQPGFFGAANGLVDFLAYAAAAQVIAIGTALHGRALSERGAV